MVAVRDGIDPGLRVSVIHELLNEAEADRFSHGLGAAPGAEVALDVVDNVFDRAVGVADAVGDFLGGGAGGEQIEDLESSSRQPG